MHAWRGAPWKCDQRKRRSWSQHVDAETRRRERSCGEVFCPNLGRGLKGYSKRVFPPAPKRLLIVPVAALCATLWLRARIASLSGTHQPSPDTTVVRTDPLSMSRCAVCSACRSNGPWPPPAGVDELYLLPNHKAPEPRRGDCGFGTASV